jgi:hypothetical protein
MNVTLLRIGAAVIAIPAGIGVYMFDCWQRFGDPIAFIHAEASWFHISMPIWDLIRVTYNYFAGIPNGSFYQARFFVDLIPLIVFFLISIVSIRSWPFSYTLFMVVLFWMSTTQPTINGSFPFPLMSVSRYLLVSVPCLLVIARFIKRWPWLDHALISGGFMFQALFLAFYLNGGWIV